MNDLYLIVNAVEGLDPGSYLYRPNQSPDREGGPQPPNSSRPPKPRPLGAPASRRPSSGSLKLLRPGNFRDYGGFLGLEQAIPADAAVDIFFMANLNRVFETYGNRGYRAAQMEAGILGGRLYLAAYALRLGASGLTFYDDAVTEFFSPHAQGKSAIFLMALGASYRRNQT